MTNERIESLNELGFRWSLHKKRNNGTNTTGNNNVFDVPSISSISSLLQEEEENELLSVADIGCTNIVARDNDDNYDSD